MILFVFKKLLQDNFITEEQFRCIERDKLKPLSVHWELRTLLYLGILLLTTAMGIFVYKNIDTIGHQVIIILIALACAACFFYCFKKSKGYSGNKVESPGILFDYILLSGCLLLLIFIGYIQFEYHLFGNRWGLSVFIPMVILFFLAYYFDHLGVLSLAITNLAAWLGITVTPVQILDENNFGDVQIIYTGLILGAGLTTISYMITYKNIKAHFAFTYKNFGLNILFISLLAALFYFENIYMIWFVVITAASSFFFRNAIKEKSFYFLVITVLYAYTAVSYVVINLLSTGSGKAGIYIGIVYFIASGIALIRFLILYNKKLKKDESIQQQ
ncbi:MAG: DUF2157 domain-containing protein [Ferruginibacter sp.]